MATAEPKLHWWIWQGTQEAHEEALRGEMEAPTEAVVRVALRRKGIVPVHIRKKPQGLFGIGSGSGKIKDGDLVAFIRQLSTLINAGVPLLEAMSLLEQATVNVRLRRMLKMMRQRLSEGWPLSSAFAEHSKYFDPLFVSMVVAGEKAGILDTVFQRLADYREKTAALQKKLRSAMLYPAAIITVMIAVVMILMLFVIPPLAHLYQSFHATLPALTLAIIAVSHFLQGYWWMMLLGAIGAGYLFVYFRRTSRHFRHWVDRIFLHLPILGRVLLNGATARFARTLASMQAAGVPIQESLESLSKVSDNVLVANTILHARDEVLNGQTMTSALLADKVFPLMASYMLAIGESTGNVEVMSNKIADFYENEVNETVDRMSTLLEPVIMVILGVIVGTLIVAMYLPILDMGSVVTHGMG